MTPVSGPRLVLGVDGGNSKTVAVLADLDGVVVAAARGSGSDIYAVAEPAEAIDVVVGLVDLSDDRLVYRITAPIRAGKQEDVRRVWRSLLLDAFERGDLQPPETPETVVRMDAIDPSRPLRSVTEPSE